MITAEDMTEAVHDAAESVRLALDAVGHDPEVQHLAGLFVSLVVETTQQSTSQDIYDGLVRLSSEVRLAAERAKRSLQRRQEATTRIMRRQA